MTICGQKGQGRRVSGGGGGGEFGVREVAAVVADDSDVDGVGVGVDPTGHVLVRGVLRDL
ncbi:hypothetical protein HUT19_28510 [Streptomyces sp. NA02950]|uniref:hypothetical protein n=1 Tax=Streptomyces sp. NA02950 TaxID=2742137 RepID=UPI00159220C4|nr:hypothetical protein [Streptomyces sp. NA02950]QKV95190.1 hypothetical protein HUT19_28510 [Streptomyces sp. NA02950]